MQLKVFLHLEMENGISEKFSLQPPYAKNHTTWSDPNAKAGDKFWTWYNPCFSLFQCMIVLLLKLHNLDWNTHEGLVIVHIIQATTSSSLNY